VANPALKLLDREEASVKSIPEVGFYVKHEELIKHFAHSQIFRREQKCKICPQKGQAKQNGLSTTIIKIF